MLPKELNIRLIATFPEIRETYEEETSWQEGDDTGAHVVYADVFVPFIKQQLKMRNEKVLERIFVYIEEMLCLGDEYAFEVVSLSVLESLLLDNEVDKVSVLDYAKKKTHQEIDEIILRA